MNPWTLKSHRSALQTNAIVLIFHPHSVTNETPVFYKRVVQKPGAQSEAKLNHVLRHNPRAHLFCLLLETDFGLTRSIRLMTLIKLFLGGKRGESRNLKWFKHTKFLIQQDAWRNILYIKECSSSHPFVPPQPCNSGQERLLVRNCVFTKAGS